MAYNNLAEWNLSEFRLPHQAMQDTTWFTDPANPTIPETGPIHKGGLVWLQQQLFGSGPTWQPARLADGSVRFINPHHFIAETH